MPKLHLVGITADHKGLVFSQKTRAKTGDLVIEITDDLTSAIEEARRLDARSHHPALSSPALPTRQEPAAMNGKTGGSRLSPKEIQHRLRMGESVQLVAKRAGVTIAWIERFSTPVASEKARMVEMARGITCSKQRLGPSSAPMGKSVLANVLSKGVDISRDDFDSRWGAFMIREGVWTIRFEYTSRGRSQIAEWELLEDTETLTPCGRLASDLAYWDPQTPLPAAALLGPAPRPSERAVEPPKREKRSATPVLASVTLPAPEEPSNQEEAHEIAVLPTAVVPSNPEPKAPVETKLDKPIIAARPVSELAAKAQGQRPTKPEINQPSTKQKSVKPEGPAEKNSRVAKRAPARVRVPKRAASQSDSRQVRQGDTPVVRARSVKDRLAEEEARSPRRRSVAKKPTLRAVPDARGARRTRRDPGMELGTWKPPVSSGKRRRASNR